MNKKDLIKEANDNNRAIMSIYSKHHFSPYLDINTHIEGIRLAMIEFAIAYSKPDYNDNDFGIDIKEKC